MSKRDTASQTKPVRKFSMRWKLLLMFGGVFTLIFAFVAVWILQFTTNQANDRLVTQLAASTEGAAKTIDPQLFISLISTVDKVVDTTDKSGYGYPTSPLYKESSQELLKVNQMVTESLSYSYFRDLKDGKLYFAASSGFLLTPQFGVRYRVPVADIVDAFTLSLMEKGLETTTAQPEYSDFYGSWISSYSPVRDASGKSIGAVGLDYPVAYVDEVRSEVQRNLYPILAISYGILILLVLAISTRLVRPLKRLTDATARVADGEYDLNVRSFVSTRFPDEMSILANSFAQMASKVDVREKSLTQEVQRLKVEIDQARRVDAVREITESDSFAELALKAQEMRRRMRGDDAL